ATVRQVNEYVIVEAVTVPSYPTETPECFSWSGGIAVPGEPFKRKLVKNWPRKAHISATCGSNSDYVDVWIVWASVDVTLGTADTIDTENHATLVASGSWPSQHGGGNKLGEIDYDSNSLFTYRYAGGKMQAKATLVPADVEDVIVHSAWGWRRDLKAKYWDNGGNYYSGSWDSGPVSLDVFEATWFPGMPISAANCDLIPDDHGSTREVYNLDLPGCPGMQLGSPTTNVFYTSEAYVNFTQYLTFFNDTATTENCCNGVEWSYTAWVDMDKTAGSRVEKNVLSLSHISLPPSANYSKRTPTISSISPNNGPQAGGTSVTITGTNFTQTLSAGPTVKIGGISASNVVLVSTTSITCNTPAGTPGAKDVVVSMPDYISPATSGSSATLTGGFTYNP
ncbi:MAG: IPT/TIG domain-containing protein, partial [Planctomycetota bacterium]